MRITKRQLKRIIREEKSKMLREYRPAGNDPSVNAIHSGLGKLLEEVVETLSVEELEYIANYHSGSDFDEATRSLARIALANIALEHGPYRGG